MPLSFSDILTGVSRPDWIAVRSGTETGRLLWRRGCGLPQPQWGGSDFLVYDVYENATANQTVKATTADGATTVVLSPTAFYVGSGTVVSSTGSAVFQDTTGLKARTVSSTPPGGLVLTLASDPSDIALGSYRAVSATFSGGQVAAGTAVEFTITGANPLTGQALTDTQGRAEFVYGAAVEGLDEIRALASVSGTSVAASPLTVSASVPPLPLVTESRYVTKLTKAQLQEFGTFAGATTAFQGIHGCSITAR